MVKNWNMAKGKKRQEHKCNNLKIQYIQNNNPFTFKNINVILLVSQE